MEFNHISVLLKETVDALNVHDGGLFVDCTAGGGGHSAEILSRMKSGKLVSVDQDPDAIATLKKRFDGEEKITIVHDNFENIDSILTSLGYENECADGIMADLGVSSYQLDNGERGFSYHKDAPLDMRMSGTGVSAEELVNNLSQQELQRIIYTYGDEKFAPAISKNIVRTREKTPITSTLQLADVISSSVPSAARRDGHPARKTFQALRIEVNGEIEKLENTVDVMFDRLALGGRLAIITFHSLEDRVVKTHFRRLCEGCTCPPDFPVCVCGKKPRGKVLKPVLPSKEEIERNPRSRSAKLRIIEKINL